MISAVVFSCLISVISSFPTNHLIARRDTTSSEDCMNKCSREVIIVCGNDGMVYPNSCLFDCTRSFVIKDLESVDCPFVSFKEFKALNDRSSDQDDSRKSSLPSKESKASQVSPNSNSQEDAQALLSLARLIRKVEGKEEENDDNMETLRMSGESSSLSNELGHGKEDLTYKISSVNSAENIHQNIWNTLYALRKANQKIQSAKHAKKYVLHELDNIVLNLKDDEKMSHDPNSNVMNKVERLLKEKDQSSFPFKRHLIDYEGLKDNVLPLYHIVDTIPESTTPLYKQEKSLNVDIVSVEKDQYSTESSMESKNEELGMNNEEHRETGETTTSDLDDVIEAVSSHDSFKEDTEYTDAPDVFPNTESLENFNKRIITYDFGQTSDGNDEHLSIPFLSQTEPAEDYNIKTSEDIEQEMDLESHKEVDRDIDQIIAIINTMGEATTTEIDTNYSIETTTINDAVTEQTNSEEVFKTENPENVSGNSLIEAMIEQTTSEEVQKTELPENVSESSQTISETDNIPVLESSDNLSDFEILDTDDNVEGSEQSTTQHTDEKVKIKSRNRISDSNELFATESLVGKSEDNTTQKFQETADNSNSKTGITESNEFTDFDTAENAQRDSTSPFETDSALLTSAPTDESSQERKQDIITTESTSDGITRSSSFMIDTNTDVTLASRTDVTSTNSPSVDATNTDLTSSLVENSDLIDIGAANPEVTTTVVTSSDATSTEDAIVGAASSSDPFVGTASTTSEKELIISEEPILTGNEPIFIPHPVPEDTDDFDRLVYPDTTAESIENLFVGDESMNLPNYLDYVDRPRPIIV